MRVLVTGASGFLGGRLCPALSRDHEVVGMVRKGSDTTLLDGLGIELRIADLEDPGSLDSAVRDVDAVVHLAALYSFTGRREDYQRINVEGTRNLLRAVQDQDIPRFIYCSTTEAIGPTGPEPADENHEPGPTYDYGRSKLEGERLVRALPEGIEQTILRPSGIYGPGNVDDVSYWFVKSIARSPLGMVIIGDGMRKVQFVHVDDVVQGFRLALDKPRSCAGGTYHITDSRSYTFNEVYFILADLFGRPPPRAHLPVVMAKLAVAPVEVIDRLRGRGRFMWRMSTMNTFTVDRNYSIERAVRDLGYRPRWSLQDGLAATVQWYRDHGFL
jgi:dihydroflavonol-4-reductase